MKRRTFLAASSSTVLALPQSQPKKIAAILTEYRPNSHADVIIGKYLEGFNHDDQPPYPRSKIVSMFTEQVPKTDMSRERAKKYGVPIYRTVSEALTLGGQIGVQARREAGIKAGIEAGIQAGGAQALGNQFRLGIGSSLACGGGKASCGCPSTWTS
jgi:hypothetical protein